MRRQRAARLRASARSWSEVRSVDACGCEGYRNRRWNRLDTETQEHPCRRQEGPSRAVRFPSAAPPCALALRPFRSGERSHARPYQPPSVRVALVCVLNVRVDLGRL